MPDDLFSKPAVYTIDSSSLMAIFSDTPWVSKNTNAGLWDRIQMMINEGIIVSHVEVLAEIKKDGKKGEELFDWAHSHEYVFKKYEENLEGQIIRNMSARYKQFVNNGGKPSEAHADPWLIAQAKRRKLVIISEETLSGSADPARWKLPNVCADPSFGVQCINLWALTQQQNWKFR